MYVCRMSISWFTRSRVLESSSVFVRGEPDPDKNESPGTSFDCFANSTTLIQPWSGNSRSTWA